MFSLVLSIAFIYFAGAFISFGVLSTTDYMTRKFTGAKKDKSLILVGSLGWFVFWPYQFIK